MAISKKNKRKVIVDGKEYFWWVFDEYDQTTFDGIQVKIVSADQTHFFKYGLQQAEKKRRVVLALKNYTKSVHLSCPKFENEERIITNSGINRLIQWCKNVKDGTQYVLISKYKKMTESEKKDLLKELQEVF